MLFRSVYRYVSEKVKRNQYFINELINNNNQFKWHDGSEKFSVATLFYNFAGDETPLLRLCIMKKQEGKAIIEREYLYDNDNQLIYAQEKQINSEKYAYKNIQIYFDKSICINIITDLEIVDINNTNPYREHFNTLKTEGDGIANSFLIEMKEEREF